MSTGLLAVPAASHAFEVRSHLQCGQSVSPECYQNNFGCTGESKSPMLEWKDPPEGTKRYAITFFDERAPTCPFGRLALRRI